MEAYFKSQENHDNVRKVTEEERETLIKGLKNKWDSLYKDYLRLPMVVDTPPKKMLKERLETELGQLEKDVQLLETYKDIYVADWPLDKTTRLLCNYIKKKNKIIVYNIIYNIY